MNKTPRPATQEEIETILSNHGGGSWPEADWQPQADGGWWLVHEADPANYENNLKTFERIKKSTDRWAKRRRRVREIRSAESRSRIWVRFPVE
jgi:hypothetical protein